MILKIKFNYDQPMQNMQNPIFFKTLVDLEEVETEINRLLDAEEEQREILDMVDSTFNHAIITRILDELDEGYHEDFMTRYLSSPQNPEILVFLIEKIPDIKEKISDEAKKVKKKVLHYIKKIKK